MNFDIVKTIIVPIEKISIIEECEEHHYYDMMINIPNSEFVYMYNRRTNTSIIFTLESLRNKLPGLLKESIFDSVITKEEYDKIVSFRSFTLLLIA